MKNGYVRFIMAAAAIFTAFTGIATFQPECDYFSQMEYDKAYYAYNAEYPGSYGRGISCRWVAVSPPDTRIVLSCNDINLPKTQGCSGDRLTVSLSGALDVVSDGHNYCGQGELTLISDQNKISIGMFSTWHSNGGRFACSMTAIRTTNPPTTSTTTQKPPSDCDCGWKQGRRIVGGEETGINEFPSMAALLDVSLKTLFCGASIISQRYAISAAHCAENRAASAVGLLVGDHDISTGAETNAAALYQIAQFIIHEGYRRNPYVNDIALVKTNLPMTFSIDVGPICLPFYYTGATFTNERVTIMGWGTLEFAGPKSDKLMGTQLSVVSNQYCDTQYNETIHSSQICLYENGKDSCQGDSGGPCVFYNTNLRRNYLIGLISYGLGCATNKPSINTRVTSYLDWIISKTPDAQYCVK